MRVDRERFLLLASAIAAGTGLVPACSEHGPPPQPPPQPVYVYPIVVYPPPPPASPTPTAVAVEPGPPPPTAEPPSPAQPIAKPPNPYDGTPVTAQSCDPALNMVGTPPKCELRAPGPTCESFLDTKQECPTLTRLLKPRVAAAAIDCLQKRSGTQAICEFNVTSICAYEALGSACRDPSAKAACDGVMARCGAGPRGNYNKMTRESCEAGVAGIADNKRKKFISCITESCRFETCLTYL